MSIKNKLINLKKHAIGRILSRQCIDNVDLTNQRHGRVLFFDHQEPSNLIRNAVVSLNSGKLERAYTNKFSRSGVMVFEDARIEAPYGFAYGNDGRLICPPNWPMSMLVNGFPIRNFIRPNGESVTDTLGHCFYLLGPGVGNYYHWLTDKLTTIEEYLSYKSSVDQNCKLLCPSNMRPAFKDALMSLGIEDCDIICLDHTNEIVAVERLVVPTANKSLNHHSINNPQRVSRLVSALKGSDIGKTVFTKTRRGTERIFISRKDAIGRGRVSNEDELADLLSSYGFKSITLSGKSLAEQMSIFYSADQIVSLHGAGLTNLLFCYSGARVLEVLPANFGPRYYTDIAQALGLKLEVFLVREGDSGDMKVDIESFRRHFDRFLSA